MVKTVLKKPTDMLGFKKKTFLEATVEYPLVGGFNPSDKYEFVSLDDEIPN